MQSQKRRERATRLRVQLPHSLDARFWLQQQNLDEKLAQRLAALEAERVRAEFRYNMHIRSLRRVRDELRADRCDLPSPRPTRTVSDQ